MGVRLKKLVKLFKVSLESFFLNISCQEVFGVVANKNFVYWTFRAKWPVLDKTFDFDKILPPNLGVQRQTAF